MPVSYITYDVSTKLYSAYFDRRIPDPHELAGLFRAISACDDISKAKISMDRKLPDLHLTIQFALSPLKDGASAMAEALKVLNPKLPSTLVTLTLFATVLGCGKHGFLGPPAEKAAAPYLFLGNLEEFDAALHRELSASPRPLNFAYTNGELSPKFIARVTEVCAELGVHVQRLTVRAIMPDPQALCSICMLAAPNVN